MSDLQVKTNISVYVDMDRVVLRVNKDDIFIPYAASFRIAQGMRVASKGIIARIREPARWDSLANDENIEIQNYSDVSPGRQVMGKFGYRVECDGERVTLNLGDAVLGIHFVDALKISQWIRAAGTKAKLYAGDTGKSLYSLGALTNAEDNYRLGV